MEGLAKSPQWLSPKSCHDPHLFWQSFQPRDSRRVPQNPPRVSTATVSPTTRRLPSCRWTIFTRPYSLVRNTIGDGPPNSASHPEVLSLNLSFLPDFSFHFSSTHNNLPREPEPQPSGCPSSLFYHRLSLEILLGESSSSSNSSSPFPSLRILGAPHHLSLSFPSFFCLVAPDQPPSTKFMFCPLGWT